MVVNTKPNPPKAKVRPPIRRVLSDFPGTSDYLKTIQVCEGKTDEIPIPDWTYGPCGMTRDSGPVEEANYDAALAALDECDPYGNDYEAIEFPHPFCGWFRGIFTRPGSDCEDLAAALLSTLQSYKNLDDDLVEAYKAALEAELAELTPQRDTEEIPAISVPESAWERYAG